MRRSGGRRWRPSFEPRIEAEMELAARPDDEDARPFRPDRVDSRSSAIEFAAKLNRVHLS